MSTVVKDLGAVSAYAYAVEKGYTGTEAEFAELMADYAEVGQRAEDAADSALESKTAAQTAATTATNKASEATTAAQTATTKAGEASTSASTATSAKDTAVSASQTATTKATEATTAAETAISAKTDAVAANTAAQSAKTAAQTAQAGAETAAASVEASAAQITQNATAIDELKSDLTDVNTALETKAEIDGYYEDMTVGDAEQLVSSKYVEDSEPYLYRTSGGSKDIGNREYVDAIVGGTVNWNQLAQFVVKQIPSSANGITYAYTDGTSVKITGTAIASEQRTGWFHLSETQGLPASKLGHKMIVTTRVVSGSFNGTINYGIGASSMRPIRTSYMGPLTITSGSGQIRFQTQIARGTVCDDLVLSFNVFDITQMFGTTIADYIYSLEQANAGAGVAFFKSLFPKDYYEYNEGELISVSGLQSHDMVGFNQWDEETEIGGIDSSTGQNSSTSGTLRTANYIPILPDTVYFAYFKDYPDSNIKTRFYDADKNYIGYVQKNGGAVVKNKTFTTPSNAYYLRFQFANTYGTTYNNDICINLSWSGWRDGEYEPYEKHSYPLDNSLTLRGIPKLDSNNNLYYDGDRYLPDGKVERRYGVVDLGTLTWTYNATTFNGSFSVPIPTLKQNTALSICSKYESVDGTNMASIDKVIYTKRNGTTIYIKDSAYTDATAFKTAMSGVMLVYELATPTTEEATPYQHLQQCDPNGTEEFVSTGIVPVGHETRYPENLRAKIEGLPWDFSSLIAPTEKTNTASRNYTAGSLLIMGNVLYKVTANIANGGTITPNTNVTATTLSEILSALAQ